MVQSIATRPKQFTSILSWSQEIASDRLIPFLSVHPDDPKAGEHVRQVHAEGFRGIKLHPYYQSFEMPEARMAPIYEAAQDCGLLIFMHTGFDLAYPRDRRGAPSQTVEVLHAFPDLRLITSHLGAWEDWDEVRRLLLGKPIYMETSFSVHVMGPEAAR